MFFCIWTRLVEMLNTDPSISSGAHGRLLGLPLRRVRLQVHVLARRRRRLEDGQDRLPPAVSL